MGNFKDYVPSLSQVLGKAEWHIMNMDTKKATGSSPARFWRADEGATAIEYGMIAAAVGLTLVAVMPAFNAATNDTYTQIVNYFDQI